MIEKLKYHDEKIEKIARITKRAQVYTEIKIFMASAYTIGLCVRLQADTYSDK